ncbi:raffinose/stachyose/melibiose transport system permease protein [Paenibacillus anaericanus]|uniref:Sugar ABC transporter permease n=1 Tax=Paenibacillus anaericanus TaxID=170367 RepID=A0A3S1EMI4_9BACL|nr:sugar ABC transporter permease [Paenibacillus anaericanus]MDQ0089234.1 raffinose/stachyose/melibiose transport system permease protein [Paenibacillus anaericanus]RUT48780.1 sugar ABC transporter permease [Paenibacillus anaericanus]
MLSSSTILNVMYIPALIFFAVFIFYPFIEGIRISFTNWDGYSQQYSYVGFEKYWAMLSDKNIGTTIINTIIFGFGSTILQNVLGLAYALFLDQQLRAKGFVRTIVYLPVIISSLIMGYIWYFFFQFDGGAVNDILALFGAQPVDWLASGPRAVWIITFVNTFQFMGVAMTIFVAGLQSIPKDYYEAASIDGANWWSKFKNITLPLLMPAITVNVVLNIIGGLKLFDVIVAMTNGGPGYASSSLSTMMYNLYFARQDAGYAAALGNVMFLFIAIVSITSLILLKRKEVKL